VKAESDQILEAKVTEARDLNKILARRLDRQSHNELEEDSVQLRKPRAENSRLEERLRDATEANRCIQRQHEQIWPQGERLESNAPRAAHEQAPTIDVAELTVLSLFHFRIILRDLSVHRKDKLHSLCQRMPSNSPQIRSEPGFALSVELACRLILELQ
jgi:hypothetical protein